MMSRQCHLFTLLILALAVVLPGECSEGKNKTNREINLNMTTTSVQDYKISLTWDGKPIDHSPAQISLRPGPGGEVLVSVEAPYWSDPAPPRGLFPPGRDALQRLCYSRHWSRQGL